MELEDDDPRLIKSANELLAELQPFVGRHFDAGNVERICELVQQHRIAFKREYGAEFPPMVPFVLPSLKFIHFVRADIEDQEIRIQLRNLLVQLSRRPNALPSALEIAKAVKQCWPRYRPPIEEFRADPLMQERLH
jgi:hypothetical protein